MIRWLRIPWRAVMIELHGRRADPGGSWDWIVVPGARVHPDGRPSRALQDRVARAVELWFAGRGRRLIVTGRGVGPRTEAEVGVELARAAGVPSDALMAEPTARDTRQNAAKVAELLGRSASVLIVTDTTHVLRCEQEFTRHFDRVGAVGVPLGRRTRARLALLEAAREAVRGPIPIPSPGPVGLRLPLLRPQKRPPRPTFVGLGSESSRDTPIEAAGRKRLFRCSDGRTATRFRD